jgi:hypothetical protein
MSQLALLSAPTTVAGKATTPTARSIYTALSQGAPDEATHRVARQFLEQQLQLARALPAELPTDPAVMGDWLAARAEAVGVEYRAYLQQRKAGAARSYFSGKSHALYFLQNVAPTKLVDGAWLYGTLARWEDPDFRPLIQTYLEELGDGVPEKNHVVLYKKLLASHDCEHWQHLPESHFVQGAIQLALAYDAERFLPEIVGYNLGYEQLPLHLLITAYELNELGIDPYYFTLHVTVDNGSTGHASKAVQAAQQLLARCGDPAAFLRRVADGYRLNDLGACTTSVIKDFDLEAELVRIMAAKSTAGKNMHSDYCRVGGLSINDWLSDSKQIPAMLGALETAGWIKRGEPADQSRFWRLIQSERAEMFGVFNAYEQQVLSDWIATPAGAATPVPAGRILSHRARQRSLDTLAEQHRPQARKGGVRGVIRHHLDQAENEDSGAGTQLRQLEQQVAAAGSKAAAMELLLKLMTPARHPGAPGLMATRLFYQLID